MLDEVFSCLQQSEEARKIRFYAYDEICRVPGDVIVGKELKRHGVSPLIGADMILSKAFEAAIQDPPGTCKAYLCSGPDRPDTASEHASDCKCDTKSETSLCIVVPQTFSWQRKLPVPDSGLQSRSCRPKNLQHLATPCLAGAVTGRAQLLELFLQAL